MSGQRHEETAKRAPAAVLHALRDRLTQPEAGVRARQRRPSDARLARAEAAAGCLCGAFVSGPLVTRDAALFTDLYELTMAASYFRERMRGEATFSLFVRKLPPHRAFLVAAGLEDVLAFLESWRRS